MITAPIPPSIPSATPNAFFMFIVLPFSEVSCTPVDVISIALMFLRKNGHRSKIEQPILTFAKTGGILTTTMTFDQAICCQDATSAYDTAFIISLCFSR